VHQREAFDQGGGEGEFPVGGGGGPGEPGGDLVGGPLDLLPGPCDGLGPVTGLVAGQVGDRDRVGDLHQVGEQFGLVVGQLPGPGLQDLDEPRVGDLLPRQRMQGGGQLRSGRQGHRPVHEVHHSGHASNIGSTPDSSGCLRAARPGFTRKAQSSGRSPTRELTGVGATLECPRIGQSEIPAAADGGGRVSRPTHVRPASGPSRKRRANAGRGMIVANRGSTPSARVPACRPAHTRWRAPGHRRPSRLGRGGHADLALAA
jgi:hypothetical protein